MTPDNQFNIFQILSAGDKELVHSSMLKFLIEESSLFCKEFLGIEFEPKKELYIKLEHSGKIEYETKDENKVKLAYKRLRFDLLGYDKSENGKLLFAIENKFKATPTVNQLKDYDKYLKNYDKYFIKHEDFKKYLLVYNKEQIPSDVRKYCDDPSTKWELKSYIQLNDERSIENLLKKIEKIETLNHNKAFIVKQYIEFLTNKSTEFQEYLDRDKFVSFTKENRELHFRYLLHIQKSISEKHLELDPNGDIKYSTGNDGGKNPIPSINFLLEGIKFNHQNIRAAYFGIDGHTIKMGIYYFRDKQGNNVQLEQYLKDVQIVTWDFLKTKDLKSIQLKKEYCRKIKLKESKDDTHIGSAFSLFTIESKDEKSKRGVVNDCAVLLNTYFKYFIQQ